MINPQAVKMKLGRPAEGLRSIVWADGIKERHMLLRAPSDWNATIAIDDSGDVKETFCVVVSPDGDGLKVIRMAPEELPKFSRFWDSIVGIFLLVLLVPLMVFVAIGAAIMPPEEYRD